jgi:hypothetical protein
MILLNFARPLTDEQLRQLATEFGQTIVEIKQIPTRVNLDVNLNGEVSRLIGLVGWSDQEWKEHRGNVLVKLPALADVAALLAHEVCFLAGQVDIVRLKPVGTAVGTHYTVAEILTIV